MLIMEIAGGIILAGIVLGYWRQLLMGAIVLTMLASVVLAVLK